MNGVSTETTLLMCLRKWIFCWIWIVVHLGRMLCVLFYSKIPQIGSSGVNILAQDLKANVKYFCCPPVKMIEGEGEYLQSFDCSSLD